MKEKQKQEIRPIYTVAMDGPVGAGKSTISEAVAKRLNILHLDTGAMYRCFALHLIRNNVSVEDEKAVLAELPNCKLTVAYENGKQVNRLSGEDVNSLIRTPEVGMCASKASAYAGVRERLVALQREMAKGQSLLLDGRDIGTVVLPDADVKIFITAAPEVRARRRYEEFKQKGITDSYEKVLEDLKKRDKQDTEREVSPLRRAQDAILVDSSEMTFDETVTKIADICAKKIETLIPRERNWRYVLMRTAAFLTCNICARATLMHGERLSAAQPAIIVANHLSMADPFLLGGKCRYNIRFLGKEELFKNPIVGRFLRGVFCIPVKRHQTDMTSMRACISALRDGRVLGIFPEGTRHSKGMMQEAESGTAMIALRSKAPVIPVFIEKKYRWFTHNYVYVGTPLEYDDLVSGGISNEAAEEFMERLRAKYVEMKALLEKERAEKKI